VSRAITSLQRDAAFLYDCARECPQGMTQLRVYYQQRAAALSFAARVLACIEGPL
jgi:hypothetical protein